MDHQLNAVAQSTSSKIEPGLVMKAFRPGQVWYDTDGAPIRAHSAGMLQGRSKSCYKSLPALEDTV